MNRLRLLLIFLPAFAFAQGSKQDSLKRIVALNTSDSNQVNALNLLSIAAWQTGDYKQSLAYAGNALSIARQQNWQKGIAASQDNLGTTYWYQGNYPAALKEYLASLKIRERSGEDRMIAVSMNNIAGVYLYQGSFNEALQYYNNAQKIFEQHCGDALSKDMKCLQGLAAAFNNKGNVYYSMGNIDEALAHFQRSLKIREQIGIKPDIAASYNNLGILYEEKGNDADALRNYHAALKLMEETGDKAAICGFYINMGSYFVRVKKYANGEQYLLKALAMAKEIGSLDEMKECYSDLAVLDSSRHDFKSALTWYKLFIATRDSLVNEENTKRTVQLEMNHEFEKKQENARLEAEKKEVLAAADRRRHKIILAAVSGFGLLVLGFAVFAYRSYLQKKKTNIEITRQKHLIEEKQKEILDSIHYARRIQTALIPSERYVQRHLSRMMRGDEPLPTRSND